MTDLPKCPVCGRWVRVTHRSEWSWRARCEEHQLDNGKWTFHEFDLTDQDEYRALCALVEDAVRLKVFIEYIAGLPKGKLSKSDQWLKAVAAAACARDGGFMVAEEREVADDADQS